MHMARYMCKLSQRSVRQSTPGSSEYSGIYQRVSTGMGIILLLLTVSCPPYPVKPDVSRTEDVSLAANDIEVTLEPRFLLRKFSEALQDAHQNIEIVDDPKLISAALPEGGRALRDVLRPDNCRHIAEQLNVTYLVLIGSLYEHEGELEGSFMIFIGAWGVGKQELEARFSATIIDLSSGNPLCQVTADADATIAFAGWFFPFIVGPWAEGDLNTIKSVADEVGKVIVEDANSETVRIVVMAGESGFESRRGRAEATEERLNALRGRAEAGDAESQLQLYYVEKEQNASLKWLCRAADQGYPAAQLEMGRLYQKGLKGLKQDRLRAYIWYSLAARGGYKDWDVRELRSLKSQMTPDQTIKATDMLDSWQPGQCERDLAPAASGN